MEVRSFRLSTSGPEFSDQHDGYHDNRPDQKKIEVEQRDAKQGNAPIEQGQNGVIEQHASQEEQTHQETTFGFVLFHSILPLGN